MNEDDGDDFGELTELLNQLDDVTEEKHILSQLEGDRAAEDIANEDLEKTDLETDLETDHVPIEDLLPAAEALVPVDYRDLNDLGYSENSEITKLTEPPIDIAEHRKRLDAVTNEVLTACRADRQETQDVINLFRLQIDNAVNKNLQPSRMWVDGLIKAVEVKSDINATAIKIMDANTKLITAAKSSINILNQNMSGDGGSNLSDILDQPMAPEDEF